jgi:two-component system, NarL family, nitrate/nitrite response regulator NarL
MQDIFISPLNAGLVSWVEAFPKAKINAAINAKPTKVQKNVHLIFWLHMNEDRQEWLTNTIQVIQKKYEKAKIVVLANAPNQAEAFHAMSMGVVAYSHAYSPALVLTEIKTVISHGGVWLGQDLLKRIIEVSTSLAGNQAAQVNRHLKLLTKREKEVAIEAAKGLSNKEIARILKITERTVKAHLSSAFERLGAKDRLHLALMLNKKAE